MFDNVINTYSEILSRFRQETGKTNAILAGGCLRDTFYGKPVKDLDFVVETIDGDYGISPYHRGLHTLWPEKRFQWAGQENAGHYALEEIRNENGLKDVIESTDKTINIIIVQSIPRYTNCFPDSISQMVFDGEQIIVSQRWEAGHNAQAVSYRWDIQTPRLMKLKDKYPEWDFQVERAA